jgi:hypothetical protein
LLFSRSTGEETEETTGKHQRTAEGGCTTKAKNGEEQPAARRAGKVFSADFV